MKARRRFSKEFKQQVVEEGQSGLEPLAAVLRRYEISSGIYYRWAEKYQRGQLDNEPTREGALRNKVAELERKVGQQAMEIDLLKKLRAIQQEQINAEPSNRVIAGPSKGGAK